MTTQLRIIARRVRLPGTHCSNITHVQWTNNGGDTAVWTTAQMIRFLNDGGKAIVGRSTAQVRVVNANPPYIRSSPNETPSDNLLSLPGIK